MASSPIQIELFEIAALGIGWPETCNMMGSWEIHDPFRGDSGSHHRIVFLSFRGVKRNRLRGSRKRGSATAVVHGAVMGLEVSFIASSYSFVGRS